MIESVDAELPKTVTAPPRSLLTPREMTLHLAGLVLVLGLLGLWYWLSTGPRVVPTLIEMLKDDDPRRASSRQSNWDRSARRPGQPFRTCSARQRRTELNMPIPRLHQR